MEIYLEYALLENFLVDASLLYLALTAARITISVWRLCLGGGVGIIVVNEEFLNLLSSESN